METTKPKTFVFVLMPFNEEFNDIYELGIKAACTDAGAYCERVDEQTFVDNILERIYNQIAKADVIIADMTSRNANVFYETGYAHALNKRVILLTQKADDIPFDLKHYPHIVYGGKITLLKEQLKTKIHWCIENPKDSLGAADANLQFYIDQMPLADTPKIKGSGTIILDIDIYNPTSRKLTEQDFSLALIAPEGVDPGRPRVRSRIKLSDGRYLFNFATEHQLFPGSWDSFEVSLFYYAPQPTEFGLRVFTELGPKDYSFIISS